ncbi:unnamed protein product [Ectocarpus fasciculatus]
MHDQVERVPQALTSCLTQPPSTNLPTKFYTTAKIYRMNGNGRELCMVYICAWVPGTCRICTHHDVRKLVSRTTSLPANSVRKSHLRQRLRMFVPHVGNTWPPGANLTVNALPTIVGLFPLYYTRCQNVARATLRASSS